MSKTVKKALQNTLRNDLGSNLVVVNRKIESVATWMAAYFEFEVTTMACRVNLLVILSTAPNGQFLCRSSTIPLLEK